MKEFQQLKSILQTYKTFVISSHVNPDADAIGSELAIAAVLQKLGKKVKVINYSETPYFLRFLDADNQIEVYKPENHDKIISSVDVIIIADTNDLRRTVKMENALRKSKAYKICVDHHQNPENFYKLGVINTEISSTGELVYKFIKETGIVVPDYNIALQVYSAIVTDTGSFKYERTTPETLRIVAELLELGIVPNKILDKIYDQNKISKNRLLGKSLCTMELNNSGEICYMQITQEDLQETGSTEEEVDGFVNFCLSVQGVKIGILFFELADGMKVSLRSKGTIPVNEIAKEFGGGGHINASGIRLFDTTLSFKKNEILQSAEKYLKKQG